MMPTAHAPAAPNSLHQHLPPAEARELIRRAQQFEERALTRIYQLFSDRVFRFLYTRLQDRARAEDLTNEVFLRLLERIDSFRLSEGDAALALTGWIFTIARNLLIDDVRRHKRQMVEPFAEHDDATHVDEHFDLDLHLTRADLQSALAQLTEEQQTVLLLRFEEGFTSAQIGAMLGKTDMAIKALQRRGLAAMARHLGGDPTRAQNLD